MLKIYIARHGQNKDNADGILNGHRDEPLKDVGIAQAHGLAEGIVREQISFDAVYTSPLQRAKRTAEVVCDAFGINKPLVLDALIERDFGVMTGKSMHDIERLCKPEIIKAERIVYFLSPPGAETFPVLLERAGRALEHIRALHETGNVLLVTHGDFGKMLYAAYYGLAWEHMLTAFHFGNCELLVLAPNADPNVPHVVHVEQHNH